MHAAARGTQDTRRRATLDELVRRWDEDSAIRRVLHVLTDARLVTVEADTAEVAHEALIREWPRLRGWLMEDRERLRIQRQLTRAAQEWERLGRDSGSLYRGARLLQAIDQTTSQGDELGPLEQTFLQASVEIAEHESAEREAQRERELDAARRLAEAEQHGAEAERRAAVQLRRRALMLAVAFAIALATGGMAVFFGKSAAEHATRADADFRGANSRALAAAALTAMANDPDRAGLLALQAVDATFTFDRTWTPEAEDALHRVIPQLRTELTLIGHTGPVSTIAFSPDATTIATGGQDSSARLWDAATGQQRLDLTGHSRPY